LTGPSAIPDVVVVGSAARDVDSTDPRGWRLGGTAPYTALGIARLGLRVGVLLGVDGAAADAVELDLLRHAGVDIRPAPLDEGPEFDNRETPAGRDQWCVAVGHPLGSAAFPDAWRRAPILVLAAVAGELGPEWAGIATDSRLVALALQGVVRDLTAGQRTRLRPLLRSALTERADMLMMGRDDIAPSGPGDALDAIVARGGQRIVLSAAHQGGLFLERRADGRLRAFRYPAVPAAVIRDPTGAGDSFLAGWIVAEWARLAACDRRGEVQGTEEVPGSGRRRILRFAATVASLKMGGYGLDGMPDRQSVAGKIRTLG
jgi:sugar/nucleoside kinase (ribokinase family)